MRKLGLTCAGLLLAITAQAQQIVIPDYETARDKYFWPELYANGGETLYCGIPFTRRTGLTVEHVYAAQWMAIAVGCRNRNECPVRKFHLAEADLHNLWPALGSINSSRGDTFFWEIPGEDQRQFTQYCPDYERTYGAYRFVEPRDAVKGDIARSLLYMTIYYDFPLWGMGPLMIKWHLEDPPDEWECTRNDLIEQLQGTRNPFIGDC